MATKGERREQKRHKKRHGMRVKGRSILSTLLPAIAKKGKRAKRKKGRRG